MRGGWGGSGLRLACSVAGLTLPLWCPRGAWRLGLPPYPAFSFVSCPLTPRPPSPAGKGGIFCFLMQGASPLASPRLSRKRHGLNLRRRNPAGGLPVRLPAYPAFSLRSFPHPPDPLPGGKGGIFCFLMQGASPLASPRLSRKRHGAGECATHPAGKGILAFLCKGLCPCIRGQAGFKIHSRSG